MKFYKYEGTGNDFIITEDLKDLDVSCLCKEHYGIGADGVIVIDDIYDDIIKIKIYNKDGSEASTCGNGLRCVGAYLKSKLNKNSFKVETICDIYKVKCLGDDEYEVEFGGVNSILKEDDYYIVNSGNHHVLTYKDVEFSEFVNDIKNKFDSNIEVVKILDKNNIEIRVFERGVGETLACGSACIAVVSALHNNHLVSKKVNCFMKGGLLQVRLKGKSVYLRGNARLVYKGEI